MPPDPKTHLILVQTRNQVIYDPPTNEINYDLHTEIKSTAIPYTQITLIPTSHAKKVNIDASTKTMSFSRRAT